MYGPCSIRSAFGRAQFAVHAQHRRIVDHQMQIGGVEFHQLTHRRHELVIRVRMLGAQCLFYLLRFDFALLRGCVLIRIVGVGMTKSANGFWLGFGCGVPYAVGRSPAAHG